MSRAISAASLKDSVVPLASALSAIAPPLRKSSDDPIIVAGDGLPQAGSCPARFARRDGRRGDVAGVRTGHALFVLPPTLPPDIDVEFWAESIELVRRWRASTLLVAHFGAHEDPDAHLDAMQTHLTTMTDIARECISAGGDASAQQSRFVDEMRVYMERHVPADEAALYGTPAPLDQCWLGLARYWRKRGVTGE